MTKNDQKKTAMVCIQQSTYETIDMDSLLHPLGGLNRYIQKGEHVVLKVNLLNATPPEQLVITNPLVAKRVAEAVLKLGAVPLIGDSPSGQFTKRRLNKVYEKAGLLKLCSELGIEVNYDTGTTKVQILEGKVLKETFLCDFILKADKIIALPKIKTHSFQIMTLATKIMYGAVPGLTKAKYHSFFFRRQAFADMLLDILSVAPPDLVIMDGIIGMQGNGPSGGTAANLGVLLAADHAIAMDIAVCTMLNIEPVGIPVLKRARLRRLWPQSIVYPLLAPRAVTYPRFLLPNTADYLLTGKNTPQKSPRVTAKCTCCGSCVETCPKKAISMGPEKALIDYSRCIRCYCCHEVCPEEAIELAVLVNRMQSNEKTQHLVA